MGRQQACWKQGGGTCKHQRKPVSSLKDVSTLTAPFQHIPSSQKLQKSSAASAVQQWQQSNFHKAQQAAILYSCNFVFSSLEHKKAERTSCKPRSANTCSVGTSCLFQLFMTTTPKLWFHLITQLLENLYTSFMWKILKSDSEKKQTSAAKP